MGQFHSKFRLAILTVAESFHVEETVDQSGQKLAFDLLRSRVVAGAVVEFVAGAGMLPVELRPEDG